MRGAMRWISATWLALTLAVATATPAAASPPSKVEWTKVDVPDRIDAPKLEKTLRALLAQASKKADFGRGKHVVLRARVVEFTSEEHGDVLRMSCTLVGRVEGGPSARSKIAFGGRPSERAELEKQVLTTVANGVVARLAQIVRSR